MAKETFSKLSPCLLYVEDDSFYEGKKLYKTGAVKNFEYYDGVHEAKGKVEDRGESFACRVIFNRYDEEASSFSCTCGQSGGGNKLCPHATALAMKAIEETGGYAYFGVDGYKRLLKRMKSDYVSAGVYLRIGFQALRRQSKEENFSLEDKMRCLSSLFSQGNRSIGDKNNAKLLFNGLSSLCESEEEKKGAFGVICLCLCHSGVRSLVTSFLKEKEWSDAFLDWLSSPDSRQYLGTIAVCFEQELGDLLYPYLSKEALSNFAQAKLPQDCNINGLAKALIETQDVPNLLSLVRNKDLWLSESVLHACLSFFLAKGKIHAAWDCLRLLLESGLEPFCTLGNFWKNLDEEQKKDLKEEIEEDVYETMYESPFDILTGRATLSKLRDLELRDMIYLKDEIASLDYAPIVTQRFLDILKRKNDLFAYKSLIWEALEAFPCLASTLSKKEFVAFSKDDPSARARYLLLLNKTGQLDNSGVRLLEE